MKTATLLTAQLIVLASLGNSKSPTNASPASCSYPKPVHSEGFTYLGTNIDGFEWGTGVDGTQNLSIVQPPLLKYGGQDGPSQMRHFVARGFNTFRLAVGWSYLTNGFATGSLSINNVAKFDELVVACLDTGAYCIIDLHNYARFTGDIIGQGGPTNAQFSAIWTSIANHYKHQSRIVFGIMNEPHDIPDITTWADTVQAAVTAIRNTGAGQMILLPGNSWQSAAAFLTDGSADALEQIRNPDGTTTNLIFDLHKYLDSDGSGSHAECVDDFIASTFQPVAEWLRCKDRKALITETGGGNVASCLVYFCNLMTFLCTNSDVYLGVTGWGAAMMPVDYVTSMTPFSNGTDQLLVRECYYPYISTKALLAW